MDQMRQQLADMRQGAAERQRVAWLIGIGLSILAIELAVRLTPGALEHWIYALHRLYYLPIICAGLRFGWMGGLSAALICSWSYLTNSQQDAPDARNPLDRQLEALVFCVVGLLTGILAGRERQQRNKAEHTTVELTRVYQELKNNVEHVQRAARMSALGHLSAGLAHEIRNPLAGIEGAAAIVERSPENEEQRKEFLGIIQEESRRLNRLVTQFLDFARPRPPELRPTDVGDLLRSVINLVSQTLPRLDIVIETQIASDMELFKCDPEQLKQVILNLLINSVQAMPNGGRIIVSAAHTRGTLKIRVRDEGTGIPKEMVDSIYDPFFTTKETGTGLGLPIAYQFIEQHGGELVLEENTEKGVCFAITIPTKGKADEQ